MIDYSEKNYYEFFSVEEDASLKEITTSYRKIIRKHHPDVTSDPHSEEITQFANEAYAVLSDATRRSEYDRSRNTVEEPEVEEEFTPSWGQKEEWDIPEEEPASSTPPPPPPPPPHREPTRHPRPHRGLFIPADVLSSDKELKSFRYERITAAVLPLGALLISYLLLSPFVGVMELAAFGAAFLGMVVAFVQAWRLPNKKITPAPYLLAITLVLAGVLWYVSTLTPPEYAHLGFPTFLPGVTSIIVANTFWKTFEANRVLSAKNLMKNNSFGETSSSAVDLMMEEVLKPLWSIPALRVFRVNHAAFSHMVFFDNHLVLLKGIYMPGAGVVRNYRNSIFYTRPVDGLTVDVLPRYGEALHAYLRKLDKGVKVSSVIVAFPGQNFDGAEVDLPTVTVAASQDAASVILERLLSEKRKNRVQHGLIVEALSSAYLQRK